MEVRRTLYFCDDLGRHGSSSSSSQGNRNIGGMLRVSFADTLWHKMPEIMLILSDHDYFPSHVTVHRQQ